MAKWIIEFNDEPDDVPFDLHKISVVRQITPEEEADSSIEMFKPFARKYWWTTMISLPQEIKDIVQTILNYKLGVE